MYSRTIAWALLLGLGLFRPGADRLDRWLAATCWNVPSQWNAVAGAAIRTGAVDATIGGRPAPWRQATVHTAGTSQVAIVTVSDFHRSRVTFLNDRYESL